MSTKWERQKALFLAALEKDPKERRGLLEAASAADRAEVESLLAAHDVAGATLAHSGLLEAITGAAGRGRKLGAWILDLALGLGPLGHSYRAHDREGRRVVLDVVEGEGPRAGLAAALEPLARRLLELDHPGIARTIEVGREHEVLWIAREETLGLPLDRACDIEGATLSVRAQRLAAAADALAAVHQHGLLHRDLSTRTVRLAADGRVVLTDVGLEGLLPAGLPRATTATAAPELATSQATPASDLWSLGVVAFAVLAGVPAPLAADPRQPAGTVPRGELRPSRVVVALPSGDEAALARRRTLPAGTLAAAVAPFDQLIAACLDPEPSRRPRSAELARHLRELS